MTDDAKVEIEVRCQATSGFSPKSTRPIGRSYLFLDRSQIGSVQVHSPVGPVQLHLKKSVLRIGPGRTETEPRLSIPEDNPKILLECDILLGPDNGRPKVYVMQKSKKLLSNVRQAFSKLENIECATFGLH